MLHNIIYMNMVGNGRGVGITEMLHGQVEVLIVALFAVITQLGDVWFLFLLGSILYVAGDAIPRWGIDRRRGLFVLGLVITYIALIGLLKNIFVLPRPPGAGEPPVVQWLPSVLEVLFNDTTTAAGPGFPSGHALGSTMTWGGLALVLDRGTYRTRISVAGAVVVLVSVSRLVLGVHYFVDVLVGVVLGVVVLGLLYWLTDHGTDPGRILLVAVVTGIMGIFVGITFDSVAAIGGAVGGWLVWRGVADATPAHPTNSRAVVAGCVVLGIMGGISGTVYALEPPHLLTFLATAVIFGGAIGAPMLGERVA